MSRRGGGFAGVFALGIALVALLGFGGGVEPLLAQAADDPLGRSGGLGRPYLFVFLAYAIGWLLIFGWVISIFRRLRGVEARMASVEAEHEGGPDAAR